MRGISIALAGLAWLSSCSALQIDHYFAPTAENATYSRHPQSPDVASMWSGRSNVLTLETKDVRLNFECLNTGCTSLSIGPLIFPVIPLPFLGEDLKVDTLQISIQLAPVDGPLDLLTGKVAVVDSAGKSLPLVSTRCGPWNPRLETRFNDPREVISIDQSKTISEPMAFLLEFESGDEPDPQSFTVSLGGLTKQGSNLELPSIHLESASGLEFQMVP